MERFQLYKQCAMKHNVIINSCNTIDFKCFVKVVLKNIIYILNIHLISVLAGCKAHFHYVRFC